MARIAPDAPDYDSLPEAVRRDAELCVALREVELSIRVVTPILGGATRLRYVDEVDVIRVATVRGQLRFWWRALNAHRFDSPAELYSAESNLWGGAAKEDGPGRSKVDVRVMVDKADEITSDDVRPVDPGSYALWPARAERRDGTAPAQRRLPGTSFRLLLRAPEDEELYGQVVDAVRAWLLFGGYGSRTRRGLGGLTVNAVKDRADWLPGAPGPEGLEALVGRDIFKSEGDYQPHETPVLAGAALLVGRRQRNPEAAWLEALHWLRDFRQGVNTGARNPGPPGDERRPSISNWPEADKVRRLSKPRNNLPWAHAPRHNETPAWPRAGFGLPIVGRFQQRSREGDDWNRLPRGHQNYGTEPDDFQLRWRIGTEVHSRLASPLIVKAMPLASGEFVPCALWLNRAMPEGAEVGLYREGSIADGTVAPFDRLVADGDTPRFDALANKTSLREAFLDWLESQDGVAVVAR